MIKDRLPFIGNGGGSNDEHTTETTDDEAEASSDEPADDSTDRLSVEYEPSDAPLGGVGSIHQSILTPSDIERTPNATRTGEQWAQTLWVSEFPDAPSDGLFEGLYSTPETRTTDISLHIEPRDTHRTLDSLENKLESLEANHEYLAEKRRAGARGVQKDLADYQELYDVLRNTSMRAFDASMYLTVRGESATEINADGVSNAARRSPSNLTPVTPRWAQLDSLIAASPIGVDALNESMDTRTPMLGGALGAMFPFVAGAFAEPGIEYGTYALNESPLILDRFNRETALVGIGTVGNGCRWKQRRCDRYRLATVGSHAFESSS